MRNRCLRVCSFTLLLWDLKNLFVEKWMDCVYAFFLYRLYFEKPLPPSIRVSMHDFTNVDLIFTNSGAKKNCFHDSHKIDFINFYLFYLKLTQRDHCWNQNLKKKYTIQNGDVSVKNSKINNSLTIRWFSLVIVFNYTLLINHAAAVGSWFQGRISLLLVHLCYRPSHPSQWHHLTNTVLTPSEKWIEVLNNHGN